MDRLKNKKVFVGKYSKEIQEKAFELGFKWEHSEHGIKDMPFLFFNDDGFITCLDSPDKFYNFFNNHEEVTPEYILRLEVKKKPEFKDLKHISGYYVDTESGIIKVTNQYAGKFTKNTFPTQEEALACLALSQLCQWRDKYNEGWKPDYTDYCEPKFVITFFDEQIVVTNTNRYRYVLAFKSAKIRDKFIEDFQDLIEQAKPLL